MTAPRYSYTKDADGFVFDYGDARVRVEGLYRTRSGGLISYLIITGHQEGVFLNAGRLDLTDGSQRGTFALQGARRNSGDVAEWETRLMEIALMVGQEQGVAQGAGPPVLQPLDVFLEGVVAQADWLVDDLLEQGNLYLLAARYKTGKSILAMNLILAASRGGRWLDRHVKLGPAAWFQLEDGDRTIARRWAKMCQGPASNVEIVRGPWHLTEENLEVTVHALQGRALVVVDPIISALDVAKWSDMGQVRGGFDLWRQVARRTNAVVLLTAHHRKAAGDEAEQVAGSHQAAATVDGIIEVRKGGGLLEKHERRLEFLFRDLPDMDDLIIAVDPETLVFYPVGSFRERQEASDEERAVRDAQTLADSVAAGGEVQARLKDEVLCWGASRFNAALEAAQALGLVHREQRTNPATSRRVWWIVAGPAPAGGPVGESRPDEPI